MFQLTRPRVDVDIDGYPLLLIRLAITMGLVELSYRLLEFADPRTPVLEQRVGDNPHSAGHPARHSRRPRAHHGDNRRGRRNPYDRSLTRHSGSRPKSTSTNTARGVDLSTPAAVTTPVITPAPTQAPAPAPVPTPTVSARAAALIAGDFDPLELIQPTPVPTPTQPAVTTAAAA